MLVVFDVDGTLIDSRELILAAYREAGVEAPPNILELEGVNWLGERGYEPREAAKLKGRKNREYLHHLRRDGVATLPPYDVACRLAANGHACHAYTGAPNGTIDALFLRLPSWPFRYARDGVTTPERLRYLRRTAPVNSVYVDDQIRLVVLPERWHFVHYTGQDADELYREITDCEGTK